MRRLPICDIDRLASGASGILMILGEGGTEGIFELIVLRPEFSALKANLELD